jgi:hypothetical protein
MTRTFLLSAVFASLLIAQAPLPSPQQGGSGGGGNSPGTFPVNLPGLQTNSSGQISAYPSNASDLAASTQFGGLSVIGKSHPFSPRALATCLTGMDIGVRSSCSWWAFGDSTGLFSFQQTVTRLLQIGAPGTAQPPVAGIYEMPSALSVSAAPSSPTFWSTQGANYNWWRVFGSESGDCRAPTSGDTDFARSPWGSYYTLGASTGSACTIVLQTNNGSQFLQTYDTLKIFYIKETGAASFTVTPGTSSTNLLPGVSVTASAASTGAGVYTITGVPGISYATIVNASGTVRIQGFGLENSSGTGMKFVNAGLGGTNIDELTNSPSSSFWTTWLNALPPPDVVTQEWKDGSPLSGQPWGYWFQALYNVINPLQSAYVPDWIYEATYPDNGGTNPSLLLQNASAQTQCYSGTIVNCFYHDGQTETLSYADALARNWYDGSSSPHYGYLGQGIMGNTLWSDLGLDTSVNTRGASYDRVSNGTYAAPSRAYLSDGTSGFWYNPATFHEAHSGPLDSYGSISILAPPSALAAPTVTPTGTPGSTSYTYEVCGSEYAGNSVANCTATKTTATGPATINSTNSLLISWMPIPGATIYQVFRTASGGTPSSTGQVYSNNGGTILLSFLDTGVAATGALPSTQTTTPALGIGTKADYRYPVKEAVVSGAFIGLQSAGTHGVQHVLCTDGTDTTTCAQVVVSDYGTLNLTPGGSGQPVVIGAGTGNASGANLLQVAGGASASGFVSRNGTKFTISGCSAGTTVGGPTAGSFVSGTTGNCTVVITLNGAIGMTAPNGWACHAADLTTPANLISQSAASTTTCTVTGVTVSGDLLQFLAIGF